jgi:hypothetical protein
MNTSNVEPDTMFSVNGRNTQPPGSPVGIIISYAGGRLIPPFQEDNFDLK